MKMERFQEKKTADKPINGILAKDEKGHKEYNKAVAKYENAEPLRNRPKVFSALRKAKKARKEQAVGVRLRKKTSPEDLAWASKRITKMARERMLKNRKTYAIKYMLFSKEDRAGTKS